MRLLCVPLAAALPASSSLARCAGSSSLALCAGARAPLLRRALCTNAEPALAALSAQDSLAGLREAIPREWVPGSLRCGALGMKCGMTQAWTPHGVRVPLTVIELEDVQVVQRKTVEKEGFNALKLASGWQKSKRLSAAEAGHFLVAGVSPKRFMREFRVSEDALLPVGTSITVRHFVPGQYVDVQGVTKGKGFQGVMKRHGFAGQPRSHGASKSHRSAGSSGGAAGAMYATRVRKGKAMPGKMGNDTQSMQNMLVYMIDPKHNLLYVKGSVPGTHGGLVRVQDAVRPDRRMRKANVRGPFPTFLPGDEGGGDDEVVVAPAPDFDPIAKGRLRF
jgi:large subunit ribosomal protein L3